VSFFLKEGKKNSGTKNPAPCTFFPSGKTATWEISRAGFVPYQKACTIRLRGKADKRFIMVSYGSTLLTFVVALIISTVIIYYIAKWFGAKDSLTTAVLAALIGTAVYTLFYYVLGQGLIPAFIAGIVWLLALQKLYTIGWLRALLIAVVIWIVTSIVGWFLPVL
jgi:Na+/melibiose symporter-like transporter